MERYKEVLVELGQVEQKMESQSMSSSSSSSEGLGTTAVSGPGRARLGSSGRSTLQAIGSAAAAGSALCLSFFLPIITFYHHNHTYYTCLTSCLPPCRCGFLLHLRHRRPSPQHACSPNALTGGRLLAELLLFRPFWSFLHFAGGAQPSSHGRLRPGLLPLSALEDVPAAAGHSGAPAQQQPGGAR